MTYAKTYRGWNVHFDNPPIPLRSMAWSATSPDYDVDCDEDGFHVVGGAQVHAATYDELVKEIDATHNPRTLPMDSPHLLSLADRCEAASGPSLVLDRDIALTQYPDARALPNNDARISVWDGNGRTQLTVKPYTASLDAAMTLLPGNWVVASLEWWPQRNRAGVTLREVRDFEIGGGFGFGFDESCGDARSNASTAALAICAAALRALSQSHSQTERGEA